MPVVKMTISEEGKALLESAAAKDEQQLAPWMRMVLMAAARAGSGAAPKPEKFMWLGKECTREVYEAGVARKAAREAEDADLPPLPAAVQADVDATDHGAPRARRAHAKR